MKILLVGPGIALILLVVGIYAYLRYVARNSPSIVGGAYDAQTATTPAE